MYLPTQVPPDAGALPQYLRNELQRVSQATATPYLQIDMLHKAPDKPKDGMVILADGTNFDPGSGAGYYGFRAGSWRFLG